MEVTDLVASTRAFAAAQSLLRAQAVLKHEAGEVLRMLRFPGRSDAEIAQLTLLAFCDLVPPRRWGQLTTPLLTITQTMQFIHLHYSVAYAPNTRESVRFSVVAPLKRLGVLVANPDMPRPPQHPHFCYQLAPDVARAAAHHTMSTNPEDPEGVFAELERRLQEANAACLNGLERELLRWVEKIEGRVPSDAEVASRGHRVEFRSDDPALNGWSFYVWVDRAGEHHVLKFRIGPTQEGAVIRLTLAWKELPADEWPSLLVNAMEGWR